MNETRRALIDALMAHTTAGAAGSPYMTAIPGVLVLRADQPKPPMPILHRPALCLVAQGAKREMFGDALIEYREGQAAVVSIETPATGWVTAASSQTPFLGMVIEFDLAIMRDLLNEVAMPAAPPDVRGVFVAELTPEMLDCAIRLARLLERPDAIAVVAPLIMRELGYWLLSEPYGAQIASLVVNGPRASALISAIQTLRSRFTEPVSIDELASEARMSASTFHRQFKLVTSMTPNQYQKQLRLLDARNRMIYDGATAEAAAYGVGYESQSQFSREYARMFGAPPRRDVMAVRGRMNLESRGSGSGDHSRFRNSRDLFRTHR